ncbi:MAG TPA: ATP-grasp domain-containing protein [Acidimicrobiales bacterium]|nr:ATP-grasp domain-containing protein [Acidimicrobiales bacterium]
MSSPAEVGIAAAGAALVGAAVAWRTTARRGARAAIASALVSPNPSSRMAALRTLAAEGIAPFTQLLHQRVSAEKDPEVRRLLAEVIAQSQWEPSSDEALAELRLWAHRELERADEGALRGGAGRGAAESSPPGPPAGDAAFHATWWQLAPRAEDPAVVLVTGAGGPAGVAVVRWLKAAGHRVIAADSNPSAVGLRLADGAAVLQRADSPRFVGSVAEAARVAGAGVLIPTVAEELVNLAAGRDELEAAGLRTWLPDPDAVMACIDKWVFAKVAQSTRVRTPATNLGSAHGVPGPFVVKPRFGRGSRDIVVAEDEEALAYALHHVPEPIVQTMLTGREFTADALVAPDGRVVAVVPRWRLETRGGISTRGETFVDPGLIVDVAELLGALGLRGPANVQGFVDSEGVATFTEVNPRFSGGLPLSLAAGADLVGEYVHVARGGSVRPERCTYRSGVVMTRYFEEVFDL